MNWKTLYPEMPSEAKVEFADVGCGYGGLLGETRFFQSLFELL